MFTAISTCEGGMSLETKYPSLIPYQYASNCPISGIDEDGLEWAYYDKDPTGFKISSEVMGYIRFIIESDIR